MPDTSTAAQATVAVFRHPVGWFAKLWWDLEVLGEHNLPRSGPAILSANHLSFIDPVLVTLVAGRNLRYLAVDELFGRSKFFDGLTKYFGALPTPRDRTPVAALRDGIAGLERGDPLVVFPEGRRVEAWGIEPPARGAAWLSLLMGAPLVPIAIEGAHRTLSKSERRFRRTPLRVWIEPPLDPLDFMDHVDPLAAVMERWHEAVDARLGPDERRVAAGPPPGASPGNAD